MYCLELIKFDVSNASYYVEVESGALLCDVTRSWKMIFGGHGKSGKFLGKSVGTLGGIIKFYRLKIILTTSCR